MRMLHATARNDATGVVTSAWMPPGGATVYYRFGCFEPGAPGVVTWAAVESWPTWDPVTGARVHTPEQALCRDWRMVAENTPGTKVVTHV